jgi:biopolymer transport protein ExbD
MKQHKMPDMKEGGVNVTPLIDIVMCLIIFFMLVAKIGVKSGADPKIKPPSTLLGGKIEDMGNTITLNVRDFGLIHKEEAEEATKTGNPAPAPPTAFELAHPRVEALVENSNEPKQLALVTPQNDHELRRALDALVKHNPKLRVIIRADKEIKYDLLQQVLVECSQAHVQDFNFEMSKGAS